MEAIAREAGVAKATLYSQFPDKDAVYAAVVERIAEALSQECTRAFSQPGAGWERAANALAAKHRSVFRLLEGSAHADELYRSRPPGAAQHLGALDQWLEKSVIEALAKDGHSEPVRYGYLLIAAAEGIALRANRAEEIGPAIRLLAEKLLSDGGSNSPSKSPHRGNAD